ncbi:MAG: Fic family protein [Patescibacteria group bacterium]|nr:Fic family protein [Patescibacteria group bacterium]
MFQPKYDLTKQLLTNITQVERLYGQLESLKIPQKLELNLERDNLIQSAFVSNSIEGNPLSKREVTNLLLSDRIAVNRDEKEVTNYFEILKNLNQLNDKPINIDLTLKIHRNLMQGVKDQIKGEIRNEKVVIGKYLSQLKTLPKLKVKHEPPYHKKNLIKKELQKLYIWLEHEQNLPIAIKTGVFHHHFVYLHPFIDGNGRVARLLTALIFLKSSYFVNKYFVLDDYYDIDRLMYSDKLHSADKGDKTQWLEYYSKGVMYSLQAALSKMENAVFKLKVEERPTKKERQVLEIIQETNQVTSTDIATTLKVSRQQAHNLLKALVEKGFLEKAGKTKKSFYFLK